MTLSEVALEGGKASPRIGGKFFQRQRTNIMEWASILCSQCMSWGMRQLNRTSP